jgi:hypothetical protein
MADAARKTLPTPLTIDGVLLFTLADGTLLYVPAHPVPQTGPNGSPAVSIVRTPNAVMLQAGALFTLTDQENATLSKQLIAAKVSAAPHLQPAPVGVIKASLLLSDNTVQAHELSTSTSSLYPPYSAIFSATLDAAAGANAIAAINGRSGVLFVEYRFTLPATLTQQDKSLTGTLSRRADVASWFPGGSGAAHIQITG